MVKARPKILVRTGAGRALGLGAAKGVGQAIAASVGFAPATGNTISNERLHTELVELRKLIIGLKTPASSTPKKRKARQVDRARRALQDLYPPDGRPPDEITTATLEDQVATHLKPESKNS